MSSKNMYEGLSLDIKNPYPEIITADAIEEAEEEGRGLDRDNGFIHDSDTTHAYDLSREWSDSNQARRQGLHKTFGLTGRVSLPISEDFLCIFRAVKAKISKSPDWAEFRQAILPRLDGVTIENAVCLGIGTMHNSQTASGSRLFVYELAAFYWLVEYIQRQQKTGQKLRTIFQDPRFSSADARLVGALGGTAVHHPHARQYIGPKTFLFALFLPHNAMWNFALRDAEPAIFLGNDVVRGRGLLMTDAFLSARDAGDESLTEVHEVYERSERFLSHKIKVRVPSVVVPVLGSIFRNVTLWSPREPVTLLDTKGLPHLTELAQCLSKLDRQRSRV